MLDMLRVFIIDEDSFDEEGNLKPESEVTPNTKDKENDTDIINESFLNLYSMNVNDLCNCPSCVAQSEGTKLTEMYYGEFTPMWLYDIIVKNVDDISQDFYKAPNSLLLGVIIQTVLESEDDDKIAYIEENLETLTKIVNEQMVHSYGELLDINGALVKMCTEKAICKCVDETRYNYYFNVEEGKIMGYDPIDKVEITPTIDNFTSDWYVVAK